MSVHFGGKKVKELHYNGKKIKEAWYNGKKVFSSGPQAWQNGVIYRRGDLVTGYKGWTFRCTQDHRSDPDTRPWTGIAESAYWELVR
ncbi:carbohydrate-binding protein [Corynebacterium singulare]|uniref:carbohydrate-binding protein n=1 Tax=Corynebacterium singulare TaxID=161899 RepID=UPI0036F49F9A